ncbi:MAG: DUF4411 family protein [Candidatus Cloacimonetes bacterium]|nr:DUF4411 family protein [Candidatus Cloacimonadota bacterium]
MAYIIDTCSIRGFKHFYPNHFESVWKEIEYLILFEYIISVNEVYEELSRQAIPQFLKQWAKKHKRIFLNPTHDEGLFLQELFKNNKFKSILNKKQTLIGGPFADPFLIAKAHCTGGIIVTEESDKPNSVRIPTICSYYGIECIKLEQLMEREQWKF